MQPEVITGVVLVVMGIDNRVKGVKPFTEFQKSEPAIRKPGVNEKPIDEKGINLKKGQAHKTTCHSNQTDRSFLF
jgi:hypothetical protein